MSSLPINGLDLTVGGILLVSALLAFMRGFVQETLSMGAWVGASFGALYGVRYVQPYFRKVIPLDWAADAAGVVVLFLVIMFVLSLLTSMISRTVKGSALNPLDRSLGFLFGLVRGAVILCVAVIIANWLIKPDARPEWARTARTLPLLDQGADKLKALVPSSFQRADDAVKDATAKADEAAEMKKTYERLTGPMPAGLEDKLSKLNKPGSEAPAQNLQDLIGQKVQELDAKNAAASGSAR